MAKTKPYIFAALLLASLAAAAAAHTMPAQSEACDSFLLSQDTLAAELNPQSPTPSLQSPDARNPQSPDVATVTQQALDQLAADNYDQAEALAMSLIAQPNASADNPSSSDNPDSSDNPQSASSSPAMAANPQSPDNPQSNDRAWAIVAAARERAGKHASALRAYRLFLASCQDPQTRQYITQRIDACKDALARVAGVGVAGVPPASAELQSPSNIPATQPSVGHCLSPNQLRELAKIEQEASVESSEHFVVHARNPLLAKLVTKDAEAALARICSDLLAGAEYPHSVEIYVYCDHDDYLAHAADAPEWSGGAFTFEVKDGQPTRKISLTQLDKDGKFAAIMLDRVLPHEMCHLVMAEYFGDAACPLFLNEGLAMLAETGVDNERIALAGAALAGKKQIKLDQLFVKQRQDMDSGAVKPEVFYAESYSFLSYLHARLTRKQFGAFVEHLKDGCTVADSLQRALFVPADDSFIPQLWSAWTEVAIAQAQDLHALKGDLSMRD
jgi:hypothetical protein